jgi:hypothetical protein
MADTAVAITAGSGTNIDTRTESTNGNHRQVIVVGDPATNAAVASVVQDAPTTNDYGMVVAIHPDSVNANGQATMANSAPVVIASNQTTLPVTPAAGELHLGEVGGKSVTKTITMTADTAIMASADIIADTQQMDAAFRKTDGTGIINSITVFDPDDNAAFAFDLYVHRTSTSMGSENAGIKGSHQRQNVPQVKPWHGGFRRVRHR